MGIPYYFYHLTRKYKNILISSLPDTINIYALDFNGIIHPEAAKETNQEKLFLNLWNKIKNYDLIVFLKSPVINADKKLNVLNELYSHFDVLSKSFIQLITKKETIF